MNCTMRTKHTNTPRFEYLSGYVAHAAAATLALMLAAHAAEAQVPAQSQARATAQASAPQTSAPQASAEEIRDIRGPKPLGGDWTMPLAVLAGVLSGAAAYGTWRWSRRRARLPQTPVEIALERLAAAQSLIEAQSCREFSIAVSGIVRDYIEQQFAMRAAHRTTDEFLHDLVELEQPEAGHHRALAAHRGSLAGFLETCDLAKFGGWNLSAADMESLRAGAVRFVKESAPTPVAAPTAPPLGKPALTPTPTPAELPRPPADVLAAPLPPSTARSSHAAFPST